MSRFGRIVLAGLASASALLPAAARGEVVEPPVPLASATNGITAGADGNVYAVESANNSVAVLSPTGQFVRRVALPGTNGNATSAVLAPDGRVWVAIGGPGGGFRRIDTGGGVIGQPGMLTCGPAGATAVTTTVPGRVLYTAPDPTNECYSNRGLGMAQADGTGPKGAVTGYDAYDLAVAGGDVFVPDYYGNAVRRYPLASAFEPTGPDASFPIAGSAGADGIEVGPGGFLYITMYASGEVLRLDPAAADGTSPVLVASGLQNPFGMALGADGALYVASQDARLLRIAPGGAQRLITLPPNFAAWRVARVGNDIWVTDAGNARVVRVRNAGLPEPPPAPPGPGTPPVAPGPPSPKPPVKAKVSDVVSFASAKTCLSTRRLTVSVRKRKAGEAQVASVSVTIGKGRTKAYTARKLKLPVTLAGLPKGTFKVKLSVKLSDGTTLTETRTYKTCAAKAKKQR